MFEKSQNCNSCQECNSRSPLFSLLKKEELELLNTERYEVVFNPGEKIFKQGSAANHILSLTSGKVKIYLEGLNKFKLLIRYSTEWDLLGSPGVFIDKRHHYSAVAMENASICYVDGVQFKTVLKKNGEFAEAYWKQESKEKALMYSRILSLTQKQTHGRIADALLYLSDIHANEGKSNFSVTNLELSEFSNMTRDSAVRTLKSFQKDKIILLKQDTIEILNNKKLQELSRIG